MSTWEDEPFKAENNGIAAIAAYLLGNWPEPVAMRSLIRAALPPGAIRRDEASWRRKRQNLVDGRDRSTTRNNVTDGLQKVLYRFERKGWVVRGRLFVRIEERASLLNHCEGRLSEPRLIQLESALQAAEHELEAALLLNQPQYIAAIQAQRRAIQLLMQAPVHGHRRSGAGAVSRVPFSANRP